jgi:hypothetical protein
MQAEDREIWKTRPYRWKSLVAAKVLFLILTMHLPVMIARVAVAYALRDFEFSNVRLLEDSKTRLGATVWGMVVP